MFLSKDTLKCDILSRSKCTYKRFQFSSADYLIPTKSQTKLTKSQIIILVGWYVLVENVQVLVRFFLKYCFSSIVWNFSSILGLFKYYFAFFKVFFDFFRVLMIFRRSYDESECRCTVWTRSGCDRLLKCYELMMLMIESLFKSF